MTRRAVGFELHFDFICYLLFARVADSTALVSVVETSIGELHDDCSRARLLIHFRPRHVRVLDACTHDEVAVRG